MSLPKTESKLQPLFPVEDLAFLEKLEYTVNLKAAKIAKTLQKEKTILWKESKKTYTA
ncbi:MAG: hypothetical protein KDK96_09235 [Chlamydiia bacterium]|nr:hypothetical protein [Chlamydiia bacterium]